MEIEITTLSLKDIRPSDQNTRADLNGAALAELMGSINQVGLLNPIIVRRTETGLEIIAGHRRFEAMRHLKRDTIEAKVVDATDEDAAQIRLIENLHRKDLNPIEEAEAFAQLRDQFSLNSPGIAERADKSVPYVTRALALLGLPKVVVKAIREGTLTAEHGHQIARAAEDKRDKLATYATKINDWTKRPPTLEELKREIEKSVEKSLAVAPFPKDEAHYGGDAMPSCISCVFNTGNQSVLFDGAKEGNCTNPGCYTKRTNAFYKAMAVVGEKRFGAGVKYLGAKEQRFTSQPEFMGFPIVNAQDKKVQKLMSEKPEHYAFGIWKTSAYGLQKPAFVVVCTDVAEQKKARPETPDWEKQRFVTDHVAKALAALAQEKVKKIERLHLVTMLASAHDEKPSKFKAWSLADILRRLFFDWLGNWQVAEKLEAVGVKTAETMKVATKEALELYAAQTKNKKESAS